MSVFSGSGRFNVRGTRVFFDDRLVADIGKPIDSLLHDGRHAIVMSKLEVCEMWIADIATLTSRKKERRMKGTYFVGQDGIWGFYNRSSLTCYLRENKYRVELLDTCSKAARARLEMGDDGRLFPEVCLRTPSGILRVNAKTGYTDYTDEKMGNTCAVYRENEVDLLALSVIFLGMAVVILMLACVVLLLLLLA